VSVSAADPGLPMIDPPDFLPGTPEDRNVTPRMSALDDRRAGQHMRQLSRRGKKMRPNAGTRVPVGALAGMGALTERACLVVYVGFPSVFCRLFPWLKRLSR
jgi:hypothetical protein